MSTVRVATFNCENLFARYKFREARDPLELTEEGWERNDTAFAPLPEGDKSYTRRAIREVDADVLALQEVENLDTLRHFCSKLGMAPDRRYRHFALIDSIDPRFIDVAVASRYPINHIRSYIHLGVFSRDCLEVDVELPRGRSLTFFANHFKSMMEGRAQTRDKRLRQAWAVRGIIRERFGSKLGNANVVVLGDLNDYLDQPGNGIWPITSWAELEDVSKRLDGEERWSHHWCGWDGRRQRCTKNQYKQLDYILLSRSLADRNPAAKPVIFRQGLSRRATRYTGPWLRRVPGEDPEGDPKGSDHCPVHIDLQI